MYDITKLYKEIKKDEESIIFNTFLDVLVSAFNWDGLPDTVRPEYIEIYLNHF